MTGYGAIAWCHVFVPARMPRLVIGKLNREINRMLQRQDVRDRFQALDVSPLGGSPQVLGKCLAFEVAR